MAVDLPGLLTSVGALITAIGGFILVLRRLNGQENKVNRIDATLNGVDEHGEGGLTLAQRVDRIDRNTSEGFRHVANELEALSAAFRQHGRLFDEVVARLERAERDD